MAIWCNSRNQLCFCFCTNTLTNNTRFPEKHVYNMSQKYSAKFTFITNFITPKTPFLSIQFSTSQHELTHQAALWQDVAHFIGKKKIVLNSDWTDSRWAPSPSASLRVSKPSEQLLLLRQSGAPTAADDEGSTGAFVENNGGGSEVT